MKIKLPFRFSACGRGGRGKWKAESVEEVLADEARGSISLCWLLSFFFAWTSKVQDLLSQHAFELFSPHRVQVGMISQWSVKLVAVSNQAFWLLIGLERRCTGVRCWAPSYPFKWGNNGQVFLFLHLHVDLLYFLSLRIVRRKYPK